MRVSHRRLPRGIFLLAASLLAAAPGTSRARRRQAQEPADARSSRTRSRWAWCWCRWSSAPARAIAKNLDQKDFQLWSTARPVAIESFERRSDAPASVILLQDLSGSMANGGKLAAEPARRCASSSTSRCRATSSPSRPSPAAASRWRCPFTKNTAALREASERWEAYGTTALHDAVARIPQISLEGRNPKRFALLITDGVDNASRLTPEQARDDRPGGPAPHLRAGAGRGQPLRADPAKGRRSTATPTC